MSLFLCTWLEGEGRAGGGGGLCLGGSGLRVCLVWSYVHERTADWLAWNPTLLSHLW
jgi:hypothetical protein